MFHLATDDFPTDQIELAAAVRGSLARTFALPEGSVVTTEGDWPAGDLLKVDLTGARLVEEAGPDAWGGPTADAEPGPTYDRFELTADPVRIDAAAVYLKLTAEAVAFALDRAADGAARLVLSGADRGHVSARVAAAELQQLLLDRARQATAAHKILIDSADVKLTNDGPRTVAVAAKIVARRKILIGSAGGTFHLAATLSVDDDLVATLGGLTCSGEGVVANAVAPVLTAKMADFNGRQFPLAAVSLGDVRLRDVAVSTGEHLTVTASFGRR